MYKYLLILLLTGCQAHVGIAVHNEKTDAPEFNGSNPLGIVRLTKQINGIELFYEHVSSIPDYENGYGLNMFGAMYEIK